MACTAIHMLIVCVLYFKGSVICIMCILSDFNKTSENWHIYQSVPFMFCFFLSDIYSSIWYISHNIFECTLHHYLTRCHFISVLCLMNVPQCIDIQGLKGCLLSQPNVDLIGAHM